MYNYFLLITFHLTMNSKYRLWLPAIIWYYLCWIALSNVNIKCWHLWLIFFHNGCLISSCLNFYSNNIFVIKLFYPKFNYNCRRLVNLWLENKLAYFVHVDIEWKMNYRHEQNKATKSCMLGNEHLKQQVLSCSTSLSV